MERALGWLQWSRQMNSRIAEDYRLIALDMRGHDLSDKPPNGYDDLKLWADNFEAVIKALNLDHPVLSSWSYGPLVFLDRIRHYGEDRIGGHHFVGAVTKLGSDEASSVLTPESLGGVPQFLSTDTEMSVRGLQGLLGLCFTQRPSPSELYLVLGYNVSVPLYVRQWLFSRSFSNDDPLPTIRSPVLITHGAADAIVKPAAVEQHKAAMHHAQVQLMATTGHRAFWDDASMNACMRFAKAFRAIAHKLTSLFRFRRVQPLADGPRVIKVLAVEDFEPFRRLCSNLGKRPDFQVIAESSDGVDAVQKAAELQRCWATQT